jgi:hypothetical protein
VEEFRNKMSGLLESDTPGGNFRWMVNDERRFPRELAS